MRCIFHEVIDTVNVSELLMKQSEARIQIDPKSKYRKLTRTKFTVNDGCKHHDSEILQHTSVFGVQCFPAHLQSNASNLHIAW